MLLFTSLKNQCPACPDLQEQWVYEHYPGCGERGSCIDIKVPNFHYVSGKYCPRGENVEVAGQGPVYFKQGLTKQDSWLQEFQPILICTRLKYMYAIGYIQLKSIKLYIYIFIILIYYILHRYHILVHMCLCARCCPK